MANKDNNRLSDELINHFAIELAKELINFEGNLWKKVEGIWDNTTGDASNSELNDAIRLQVKKHLPDNVALADIDKVKKELTTILAGTKYSLTNITPAIRFADAKFTWDTKTNKYLESKKVDFSPFQLRRKRPSKDIARHEVLELGRYLDNLTGEDINKENALFEWFGYVLAGEHNGTSLIIEGQSGVGKSTIAKLANIAIASKDDDSIMLSLQADDIYSNKGDKFAFANGVTKPLWIVGEGSNVMEEKAIKRFNDLIDETKPTFPIRKMNQAPKNAPKFFNMLMLTNGGFSVHGNAETMKAFKNRLVIIESPATKGVLTMDEYKNLFSDKSINYFIQQSIKGYLRTKQSLKPRAAKFTQTKVENFWNDQDDNYLCFKMIEEAEGYKELWESKQIEYLTNDQIEKIIASYRYKHPVVSIKYSVNTFKNEMIRMFDGGLLHGLAWIDKRKSKKIDGKPMKPLSFGWK